MTAICCIVIEKTLPLKTQHLLSDRLQDMYGYFLGEGHASNSSYLGIARKRHVLLGGYDRPTWRGMWLINTVENI